MKQELPISLSLSIPGNHGSAFCVYESAYPGYHIGAGDHTLSVLLCLASFTYCFQIYLL